VDPKGFENIYPREVIILLLRIPQLMLTAGYFILVLIWRNTEKITLVDNKRAIVYPVIALISIFTIIILPATFLSAFGYQEKLLALIIYSAFLIACSLIILFGIYFAIKLHKTVKKYEINVSIHSLYISKHIHIIFWSSIFISMIIGTLVWWATLRYPTAWQTYILIVLVHSLEYILSTLLYVAVYVGAKRNTRLAISISTNFSSGASSPKSYSPFGTEKYGSSVEIEMKAEPVLQNYSSDVQNNEKTGVTKKLWENL